MRHSIWMATIAAPAAMMMASTAHAKTTEYELRITNNTNTDLKFWLHDGQSKHARLLFDGDKVTEYTVKAGTSATLSVQPTGYKCAVACNGCTPTIGKVYASYVDSSGVEQRNNYLEPRLEWYEQCSASGGKNIAAYTTNWNYQHGGGKGDKHFSYKMSHSENHYTSSNPAKGLTLEASKVSGHATITYSGN